ncbi:FAD/NAD(P)-binding protein [Plasticicumulans acidivorans]|uniref:Putative NAD(P)/FAD-binding protein YdhS n=1 Tax=Plasticicumulans acidivorans TaxID=886464 RepID=A0A317N086_9GAMM|nr:FAD/NAD(P)-binding protein [Plasticicumulans acidivorans]PWV65663.1 putative NAD(P)/FAD-binding protein YdhS [Plasticicumulans acidivorans]
MSVPVIAIVGAGFSGTLLAVHLLRESRNPLRIVLIERSGRFGRGLAYATANDSHLLNVRAANMSALPEQPAHFRDWLRRREAQDYSGTSADDFAFVPRCTYGRYLEELLQESIAGAAPGVRCEQIATQATGVAREHGRWRLMLAGQRPLVADQVVLCLGNFPPALPCTRMPAGLVPPHYIANPWDTVSLAQVPHSASVLIVGTGLTMVDVLLSLLDQGHSGPITALSRRGLYPQRHAAVAQAWPTLGEQEHVHRLRPLLRQVREASQAAADVGGWRAVIDGLRPHTQRLWRELPETERRRFLRHLRPYWETHRHRLAPEVAERFEAALAAGQLVLRAGRLHAVERLDDGRLRAHFNMRGSGEAGRLDADCLINCTGPQCDFTRIAQPLVRALLADGLVHADALHLGLAVNDFGQLLGTDGQPQNGLYAVGPLARGNAWELTAVPELRLAAAALGRRLAHTVSGAHGG